MYKANDTMNTTTPFQSSSSFGTVGEYVNLYSNTDLDAESTARNLYALHDGEIDVSGLVRCKYPKTRQQPHPYDDANYYSRSLVR